MVERTDFGPEINKWKILPEEEPDYLKNQAQRVHYYYKWIDEAADLAAGDWSLAKELQVKQDFFPAKRIYSYILKLLLPQDFFDFALHKPNSIKIMIQAAFIYDPLSCKPALEMLKKPSVKSIDTRTHKKLVTDCLPT